MSAYFILKYTFQTETILQGSVIKQAQFPLVLADYVHPQLGPLLASLSGMSMVALIRRLRDGTPRCQAFA